MKIFFSQRHNPQKQLSDDFKSKVESWLGDQINRAQQSAAIGARYDTKEKIIDEYENQNIVNLTYSQKNLNCIFALSRNSVVIYIYIRKMFNIIYLPCPKIL